MKTQIILYVILLLADSVCFAAAAVSSSQNTCLGDKVPSNAPSTITFCPYHDGTSKKMVFEVDNGTCSARYCSYVGYNCVTIERRHLEESSNAGLLSRWNDPYARRALYKEMMYLFPHLAQSKNNQSATCRMIGNECPEFVDCQNSTSAEGVDPTDMDPDPQIAQ